MLDWVVERLAAAGVDEIVLSLGYLPAAFEAAYPDGRCGGTRLHYASEPEPLDTAGAIRFAAVAAGLDRAREPFVVVNGDVLTDADLGALLDVHRSRGAEATIALTPVDDPSRYGVVPIDAEGRVTAFIEKPPADEAPSNWINAGTYVLEPSVLARIPDGRRVSIERETFPHLVAERSLFARQDAAYWIDAGTPESYLQVQFDLLASRRGAGAHVAASADVATGRGRRAGGRDGGCDRGRGRHRAGLGAAARRAGRSRRVRGRLGARLGFGRRSGRPSGGRLRPGRGR